METTVEGAPNVARGANIDERDRPRFLASGVTDRGRLRERNEDAVLVREELGLVLVADGVSGVTGNEGGGLAAQIAVESIAEGVQRAGLQAAQKKPLKVLCAAITQADHRISERGRAIGCPDMGTTIAALLVTGPLAVVAHVGDSRIYRLRGRSLERLTTDHTLAAEWEQTYQREAPPEIRRAYGHVVTRALGGKRPGVAVEAQPIAWESGDVFLLCSDGLHGLLFLEEMAEILADAPDLDRAVVRLVKRANDAGGHDNITAAVVRMLGG